MLGMVQVYATYFTLATALPPSQEAQDQRQKKAEEV